MAGKKELTNEVRQSELIKALLIDKSYRAINTALSFMEQNFDSEDSDKRKDAHKIFFNYFNKIIPNKQIVEYEGTNKVMDERVLRAIEFISQNENRRIEVEDSAIIDSDAIEIRNSIRGK